MSSTDKQQAEFKAVIKEEDKVDIDSKYSSKIQIDAKEGNQNKIFSCKQFLFGTQKRTALSLCFLVFSLLGVAGFIVGMLIISGDIRIQQHQIITGFDGKQYNYTNLQVKPGWSLTYNDFVVMQPILNKSRLLQQVDLEQPCFFFDSPDLLITVQQCGSDRSIILNEDQVNKLIQDLTQNYGKSRILQSNDDQKVDFNQFLQDKIKIKGEIPEITSEDFVSIDSDGNLISEPDENRRILFSLGSVLKPIADKITDKINDAIDKGTQIAQNAAQTIIQGVNIVAGIQSGICNSNKPGPVTVLKNCKPQIKFPPFRKTLIVNSPVLQCTPNVVSKIIPKSNIIPQTIRKIPYGRICPRII